MAASHLMDAESEAESRVTSGPQVIARHLKHLGSGPGVYRMLDAKGDVIYVGKARNLKARVANYARLNGHSTRIARMITMTAAMEFVSTATESEALLLEANLIKRFRPYYNVLLRDDKSFPHIVVVRNHAAPRIAKHRGSRATPGDYFGPFASAGAVNRTITLMQRAFLLRTCSDSFYDSRTRPCLLYQIKRCSGPCTGEISHADYAALVDEAVRFLRGKTDAVQQKLNTLMADASEKLEFERAALYRNRLWALAHVQATQGINPKGVDEADVFAATQDGGQTCIQVFFFRNGQNWGNRAYYPRADKTIGAAEVLESFLAQFYDDREVPACVYISHPLAEQALLAEALSLKAGRKVGVAVPQRGEKARLVGHAMHNAREALGRRLAETANQARLLEGVAAAFELPAPPARIEVYDNSHIQGASAIGAMIVAGPEGFAKNQYRKFNIRAEGITAGDDFGMMREVLRRRFTRLLREDGEAAADADPPGTLAAEAAATDADPEHAPVMPGLAEEASGAEPREERSAAWPDLVLIDGGAGQLSAARAVLAELGVTGVPLVGVAKGPDRNAGREHFFMSGRASFGLAPNDPVLYFVQRLRDEAHRFAIGTHRAKRAKTIAANPLDEIAGIGPARKRALLRHFGSAKAVARAGVTDLQAVEGINATMAQTIVNHFGGRS